MATLKRPSCIPCAALAAAIATLAWSPNSMAQQLPQILSVAFAPMVQPIPLSDGLTLVVSLLIVTIAFFALRRQRRTGVRLLGALLAMVAAGSLSPLAVPDIVTRAHAGIAPVINLSTTPGTIDLAPYVPLTPLIVPVTNASGLAVQISAITLGAGYYVLSSPTTCVAGGTLAPGATCNITVAGQPAG